jgi:hypothetical protein
MKPPKTSFLLLTFDFQGSGTSGKRRVNPTAFSRWSIAAHNLTFEKALPAMVGFLIELVQKTSYRGN